MAMSVEERRTIVELLRSESDFERRILRGQHVRPASALVQGELSQDLYDTLAQDIAKGLISYVVSSYKTPIAWVYRSGAITLPEIRYSSTTTQHQNIVREAYGDIINKFERAEESTVQETGPIETLRTVQLADGAMVVLTENEDVILSRMREEDGTEHLLCFTPQGYGTRFCPADQAEGLLLKGLVAYDHDANSVGLTDKGRAYLDERYPVTAKAEHSHHSTVAQYAELTEDELIELASELGERLGTVHGEMVRRDVTNDLVTVVKALEMRRKATAGARRRVGEYLRHHAILENKYQAKVAEQKANKARGYKTYGTPRAPEQVLGEISADQYTGMAVLRVTDLQRLVPTLMRDTQKEFEAEQLIRLGLWDDVKLTDKQAALLPCIAKGHIRSYTHGSYSGENDCLCARPDGRPIQALIRKGIVGSRPLGGLHNSSSLMLKRPAE